MPLLHSYSFLPAGFSEICSGQPPLREPIHAPNNIVPVLGPELREKHEHSSSHTLKNIYESTESLGKSRRFFVISGSRVIVPLQSAGLLFILMDTVDFKTKDAYHLVAK